MVTKLSDGGWVVTSKSVAQDGDSNGAFQQAYNANGTTRGGEIPVNQTVVGSRALPDIAALPDGGWVVTWQSAPSAIGAPFDIYQRVYDANGVATGNETLVNDTVTADSQLNAKITVLSGGDGSSHRYLMGRTNLPKASTNRPMRPTARRAVSKPTSAPMWQTAKQSRRSRRCRTVDGSSPGYPTDKTVPAPEMTWPLYEWPTRTTGPLIPERIEET